MMFLVMQYVDKTSATGLVWHDSEKYYARSGIDQFVLLSKPSLTIVIANLDNV